MPDPFSKLRAVLGAPFTTGKEKWIKLAQDEIGSDDPSNIVYRNVLITTAYFKLYQKKPKIFKWAGLAALASKKVGDGMMLAEIPNVIPLTPGAVTRILAQGNILVYNDIYWQHLAYLEGKITEIERLGSLGELAPFVVEAWIKIDQGKIWEGNRDLLFYEQKFLQRQVYDPYRGMWARISSGLISSLQEVDSPVPGGMSLQSWLKGHYPGYVADIGDFEQRWMWIEKNMLQ